MHANNASLSDDSDRSGLNDPLPRSEEDLAIERRMSRILNLLADYVLWILLLLAFHVNNSRALLEKKVGYGEALAYQWPRLLGACAVFTILFVIVKKYRKPGSKPPRFGFNLETVADMGTLLAFCFAVGVIGAF
ncbi:MULTISPECIES: hypothetical protein [Actinotignum]|uniref:Uncharacterized protein n=1 Tax=Actinotignum timonense TaxID=1870995 RepID=A0AAW9HK52_9ACTO|nr:MULTISPECIES: hypothetical protein [Actinotignum]MDE1557678.1 hypothetical protein [Actinotignum schaalii]MDE1662953.1 hypothetical protein [Actinotignum schaalii]MDK6373451.1 hypothetical protein [Actinotignum timonense]MDK6418326.1 hypothetical protein [Actinotignum timonense]MDK6589573.1 hypothetical protein [Actinotignum timonense]